MNFCRIKSLWPLLFFYVVQFYAIYFLWYNHPGPLGIDDCVAYLSSIAHFKDSVFGFRDYDELSINKIFFSFVYGLLAKAFGVSVLKVFYYGFYVGMMFMGMVLYFLFKKIDGSSLYSAIGLILFAFYEGSGDAHGFYWVVPSFYAIMFFLLLIALIFYSSHPFLYGIPVMVLMVITHTTGMYMIVIVFAAYFLNRCFLGDWWYAVIGLSISFFLLVVLFVVAECLYYSNMVNQSLLSSILRFNSVSLDFYSRLSYEMIVNRLSLNFCRYQFAKYIYGIYFPVMLYSVFVAVRNRRYPLLVLFLVALFGAVFMPLLSIDSFRFLYPFEVVTIVFLSYGVYCSLVDIKARIEANSYASWFFFADLVVMVLSILFVYESIHIKSGHNYTFKQYNPRFFDEDVFVDYLQLNYGKKFVIFTIHQGLYTTLDGQWNNKNLLFGGVSRDAIMATPKEYVIVGENYRYFDNPREGVMVALPEDSDLVIKTSRLQAGKYRLELVDSGLKSNDGLSLLCNGVRYMEWLQYPYDVRFPEKDFYPQCLMPWYLHADKPWPLFHQEHNRKVVRRKTITYCIDFKVEKMVQEIVLENAGKGLELCGAIRIIGLDRPYEKRIDLDWGDAAQLNRDLGLHKHGKDYPLLWTGVYPDMLMLLDENFKDVKAFTYYSIGWPIK